MTEGSKPATTLCPSVEHPLTGNIKPIGDVSKGSPYGQGFVVFDTHCKNDVPASSILSITGDGVFQNIEWAKISDTERSDYKITFQWGSPTDLVRLKVSRALVAEGGAALHLDGGSLDYLGNGEYGIAPNDTDFYWRFKGWSF